MSIESDVFPTVSVDRSYGELVGDIDIDLASITEYLRAKGLSDSDIMSLTIAFTGATAKKQRANAVFNKQHRRISMHQRGIDDDISSRMTNTLVHEFEHLTALFDDEFQKLLKEYNSGIAQTIVNEAEQGVIGFTLAAGEKAMTQLGEFGSAVAKNHYVEASWKTVPRDVAALGLLSLAGVGMASLGVLTSHRLRSIHTKKDAEIYKHDPDEIRASQAAAEYEGVPLVRIKPKTS